MNKKLFLLIVVILALLQVTILDYLKIFSVKPDLLLIIVVIASLSFDLKGALFLAILAGVLKDLFSANTFGLNTLLFPLWSFLVSRLSRKVSLENNSVRAALIFIIVISRDIIVRLIFLPLGNLDIPLGIFLRITFLESIYTALISPLLFMAFQPILSL